MIELSPEELHAKLRFDEVKLYLFTIGNGWRLPTSSELIDCKIFPTYDETEIKWSDRLYWHLERRNFVGHTNHIRYQLYPVRDI